MEPSSKVDPGIKEQLKNAEPYKPPTWRELYNLLEESYKDAAKSRRLKAEVERKRCKEYGRWFDELARRGLAKKLEDLPPDVMILVMYGLSGTLVGRSHYNSVVQKYPEYFF